MLGEESRGELVLRSVSQALTAQTVKMVPQRQCQGKYPLYVTSSLPHCSYKLELNGLVVSAEELNPCIKDELTYIH